MAALGREDVRKPVFGFVTSGSRPLLRDYTWSEWKDPFASVGRNGGGRIAVEAADAIAALNPYTNSSLVIEAQMGQLKRKGEIKYALCVFDAQAPTATATGSCYLLYRSPFWRQDEF